MKRLNLLKAQLPKRCPKARLGRPGGLFIVLLGFEPGLQLLGGGPVVPLLATAPSARKVDAGQGDQRTGVGANAARAREPLACQGQMAALALAMTNQTASAAASSSPCLGGAASILCLQATSFAELRDAIRSGLPFSAFLALSKQLEISPQHLSAVFGIPPRTVARRKEARHLNPQESDRLYRVASTLSQAVDVLGSIEKARVWLMTPNRALGCEIPLDLLDTDIGTRQVEEVLLRFNYGIIS